MRDLKQAVATGSAPWNGVSQGYIKKRQTESKLPFYFILLEISAKFIFITKRTP